VGSRRGGRPRLSTKHAGRRKRLAALKRAAEPRSTLADAAKERADKVFTQLGIADRREAE
jgi:hypothetical protein